MNPRSVSGGRILAWSLRGLLVICVVVVSYVAADRVVREADHLGFAPADADWTIITNDFPSVWADIEANAIYRSLTAEVESPLEPIQLALRRATGIRFTPGRWRLWLGDSLAIISRDHETVLILHPGLASRLAVPWFDGLGKPHVAEGGSKFNIAWREGFLLVSETTDLLGACLSPEAVRIEIEAYADSVRWRGTLFDRSAELAIRMAPSLPAEVVLDGSAAPPIGESTVHFPHRIHGEVARVQGVDANFLRETLNRLSLDYLDEQAQQQAAFMLSCLPESAEGAAVILTGLDVRPGRVLLEPQGLVAAFGVDRAPSPADAIPTIWNDLPGWTLPIWGESYTLCAVEDSDRVLLATSTSVMSRYLLAAGTEGHPALPSVYINWTLAAEAVTALVRNAAENELIERMSARDVDGAVLPYLRALGMLGTAELTGTVSDGTLKLQGSLSMPEAPESQS